jgi:hypothetical protein
MEVNDMSAKSVYKKSIKMDNMYGTFATKEDLQKAELKLELKISEIKDELKTEIGKVRYDLIKWMITILIGQTALFLSLIFRK